MTIWRTEDLDAVIVRMRDSTRETFREEGECPMHAIVFVSRDQGGKEEEGLAYVMADPDKDLFAKMVREAVRSLGGKCVILITEAWSLREDKGEKIEREAGKYTSLEHHPRRQEILMFSVERTDRAPEHWWAVISRGEDGKPSLGDWEKLPVGGGETRGRFVNFVRAWS